MNMASIFLAILSTLMVHQSMTADLSGCHPNQPKIIQTLFNPVGNIYSPGFSENLYPNDLYCQYSIQAPFGFRIKLTFIELDIDAFDLCMKDRLSIHEGLDARGPVHGIFCGNQTIQPILSSGNAITLVFHSDFLTGRKGFHIQYSSSFGQALCPLGETICRNRNCYKINNRCNGVDNCEDGTDEEGCNLPTPTTSCGLTPIAPLESDMSRDRVIGGLPAIPGSWPWQADMQLGHYHPNGHMCGGTLISADWVLSAAHCFQQAYRAIEWRIHLGNYDKFQKNNNEQVRYGKRIIVYPGYTGDEQLRHGRVDMKNDIALMQLNAPVRFTDHVRPACLPVQGQELATGTNCTATGWGMTRGTGSNELLKQVILTIQSANTCANNMLPFVPKSMLCVKNGKGFQDVCHGDSGGPLVCKMKNAWHVMGATSFGTATNYLGGQCALPAASTVYTKVADKISWINQMIQAAG